MANLSGGRGWLNDNAAASVHRLDAQKGSRLDVNSAGRTRAEQQSLWNLYYYPNGTVRPASQRPSWLFRPAAPGTSPHEAGNAIDTDDISWMLANGGAHGWSRPLPGSDPVHFVYNPNNDQHRDSGAGFSQGVQNEQNWLNVARGAGLVADGIRGPKTVEAYKAYQTFLRENYGYTGAIDGIWGPGTQDAHAKFYEAWNRPKAPEGRTTIRRGSKGQLVKDAQQRLKTNYAAYAGKLAVDGDFGPGTEAVVKEFQRRSGLAADGVIGPQTWAKLGF